MPRSIQAIQKKIDADWNDFKSGFQRSKSGNLTREYDGFRVTVFKRDDGSFNWSIADDDGPRYSPSSYESQEEALDGLGYELDVGRM